MAVKSDSDSDSESHLSTSSSSSSSSSSEEEVPSNDVHDDDDDDDDDEDGRKAFLSRIPQTFDEDSIRRIFEAKFGAGCVADVSIARDERATDDDRDGGGEAHDGRRRLQRQHRGFGFVTFTTASHHRRALEDGTARGSATPNSPRRRTVYVMPVVRDGNDNDKHRDDDDDDDDDDDCGRRRNICFLWTKRRCPYGEGCKFMHSGEGGCVPAPATAAATTTTSGESRKKKSRSTTERASKDDDQEGRGSSDDVVLRDKIRDRSQIDCINFKNKGKCRRGSTCPYKHDPSILRVKLRAKVMMGDDIEDANKDGGGGGGGGGGDNDDDDDHDESTKRSGRGAANDKVRQSLSVRVFGLNYDTTEKDVRDYFADCGRIMDVTFPTWEDSGRSKGYCGVLFTSPKAVMKAVALDGMELHGRWLRVQEGKMYLRKWEEAENKKKKYDGDNGRWVGGGGSGKRGWQDGTAGVDATAVAGDVTKTFEEPLVGEFGQRVKRRKKHGYKE
ncbi:hypothetical protein ACHAXA_005545 [Cyclostephanos tholiformis]|uniref:Uncharacterized protein n=1 Tax=Cyclostephanos tholiformis TaxID=382380 RepID=A0ABD3RG00_9STRA